jgi:hypothetical protein
MDIGGDSATTCEKAPNSCAEMMNLYLVFFVRILMTFCRSWTSLRT